MKIIGHTSIIKYLTDIIKTNNPAHGYLFYGPEHVGKTATARWFAKNLIAKDISRKVILKKYPDFYFIKPEIGKKNITIKQIKNLREKIVKTAFYDSYKIAIIKPVEYFNSESSNAFLKILEEPPKKTVFILIAGNLKSVLPTIRSRTEIIKFSLVKTANIIQALSKNFNGRQKKFIARWAQGKMGLALNLDADKIKNIIDEEKKILQILKSAPDQKINLLTELPKNPKKWTNYLSSLTRDILLAKLKLDKLITHQYLKREFQKLADRRTLDNLINMLQDLIDMPDNLKRNMNQQLLWQNLFLKI
ncbi:MAG: AAA family ATPase [Candidatus Jacksonbacteria bacterium]